MADLGATVVHVPLIAIGPPADGGAALRAALNDVADFDWVVVASANGAAAVGEAVAGAPGVRLAAVGSTTAPALEAAAGRSVDLVPAQGAVVSADGVVWGRLDDLRRTVPEMQIATADAFVAAVRGAVKEPPPAYAEIIKVNLGAPATEEKISEWELGKNQCAAAAKRAAGA